MSKTKVHSNLYSFEKLALLTLACGNLHMSYKLKDVALNELMIVAQGKRSESR